MVADSLPRKVRVLGWEIVSDAEALKDRGVWSEIAVFVVTDLQPATGGIRSGEHHPGNQREKNSDEQPIQTVGTGSAWSGQ